MAMQARSSLDVKVFEAGIVVCHPLGHWVSYVRPEEPVFELPEQARGKAEKAGEAAGASFDHFMRHARQVALDTAIKMGWVECEDPLNCL